jgi:phosphotriesterase-related protein
MILKEDNVTKVTRREALGLLGVGAVASSVVTLTGRPTSGAARQASRARTVGFPQGAIVRTVLKDVPPGALASGATLFHEHLSLSSPYPYMPKPATLPPPNWSTDVDGVIKEVRAARQDGVSCFVDGGHADMGRNMESLRRIAKESGVHIVASGGFYTQTAYPPEIARMSEDQIAAQLVKDAQRERHGAFGEIGSSAKMTPDERKVFRAVAKAHIQTGLPIFAHNAYTGLRTPPSGGGTRESALEQLDIFESLGVKPEHVAIGHLCCLDDLELQKTIAKRGAFVGIDRVSYESMQPDALRVRMVKALIDDGYADRVLLASDFSNPQLLKKNGGPGLAVTITSFVPKLRQAGVTEEMIHGITVDNSRRFLAFVPK